MQMNATSGVNVLSDTGNTLVDTRLGVVTVSSPGLAIGISGSSATGDAVVLISDVTVTGDINYVTGLSASNWRGMDT